MPHSDAAARLQLRLNHLRDHRDRALEANDASTAQALTRVITGIDRVLEALPLAYCAKTLH